MFYLSLRVFAITLLRGNPATDLYAYLKTPNLTFINASRKKTHVGTLGAISELSFLQRTAYRNFSGDTRLGGLPYKIAGEHNRLYGLRRKAKTSLHDNNNSLAANIHTRKTY